MAKSGNTVFVNSYADTKPDLWNISNGICIHHCHHNSTSHNFLIPVNFVYLFPLKHIVSHLYENLTLLGPSFDLALFGRPDIQHIRYPPKMHLKEAFLWHYCRKVLYGHRLAPPSIGHCDTLPFVQIALYSNWSNSYYQKLQKKR